MILITLLSLRRDSTTNWALLMLPLGTKNQTFLTFQTMEWTMKFKLLLRTWLIPKRSLELDSLLNSYKPSLTWIWVTQLKMIALFKPHQIQSVTQPVAHNIEPQDQKVTQSTTLYLILEWTVISLTHFRIWKTLRKQLESRSLCQKVIRKHL